MPSQQSDIPLSNHLENALKRWHDLDQTDSLLDILPFLARQTKMNMRQNAQALPLSLDKQLLLDLLEQLGEVSSEAALLLRRRYIDDKTGFAVANAMGISESGFYRRRRDALRTLADLAEAQEAAIRVSHTARLESRLEPSSYHKLFDPRNLRDQIGQLLGSRPDIRLFCLAGIGGIGKTSLADALARHFIAEGRFEEIAWVTARQQQFTSWGEIRETNRPALTVDEFVISLDHQLHEAPVPPRPADQSIAALKLRMNQKSTLIILDNLETVADLEELLPVMRDLSQVGWILVTSRVSLHDRGDIHTTNLDELDYNAAEALIRDEARRRGIEELTTATDESIEAIYRTAGGNPLALKLIIGQIQVRSISRVLTDLSDARGQQAAALYEFIYHQAWEMLDDTTRRVFIAMPLAARPGTTLDHLSTVTRIDETELYPALDLLIRMSLVNVGGTIDERRYSIHRLTETFLHKQVTKWMS
ncbi:MAG: hypothetical protein KDJ65_30445 [Anaerolineae bacterium]|nr:hypothetical protein [Anaerolineae bacterium]